MWGAKERALPRKETAYGSGRDLCRLRSDECPRGHGHAECACHVCEHCAELFMADGACGVCGAALSPDDLEEDDDASAS